MRNVDEEAHLHLVDFFAVFLVAAFDFKLCFHFLAHPEEAEYECDKAGKVARNSMTATRSCTTRQNNDFQYGRRGVPFAVVIGGFHHEVISTLRQVGVGHRMPVREVVPLFIVTV